ncbi:hypothetical protein HETIRDRAFT_409802 [Heterobasidion irregulare TC 32-1]|uniref:Uncharacterized protein n=1 Tax=Heterobasidion irregulare (strain TC 32-1) TaxID=747525 RepID=W4K9D3_HETIT|nr:uncharacterized protein HETIRDRAFT_409802 [Heterobasidion irregulare TC 32-1]ETW82339.1 hypothetical protein HETIRDRAFT_409802 [Heterobasidion irregulare TC 32-1]
MRARTTPRRQEPAFACDPQPPARPLDPTPVSSSPRSLATECLRLHQPLGPTHPSSPATYIRTRASRQAHARMLEPSTYC